MPAMLRLLIASLTLVLMLPQIAMADSPAKPSATPTDTPADTPAATSAGEPPLRFFRIGNGETSGTYYAIGGVIASAISNPPGGLGCEVGGDCGVPGLLAAALASAGSVENIRALDHGMLESAFAQADIAHLAQTGGTGWQGDAQVPGLRAIAALYPEVVHVITRKDAGLTRIEDLADARVSVGPAGSGTRIDALLVLKAAGLDAAQLDLLDLTTAEAARQMRAGDLDAFFMVSGWPGDVLTSLAGQSDVTLLPIDGALAAQLLAEHAFFRRATLPGGTYPGQVDPVETLSVPALWLTTEDQPQQLIHDITRVLWNDNTLRQLRLGHPAGRSIRREDALSGISIPLHPGARDYYRGAGMLPD